MFSGLPILLVEDDPIIAFDLAEAIRDHDGKVVGPAASVHEALKMLETNLVSAAILDVTLGDRDVTPVALRLAEREIPFVIHTGTSAPPELLEVRPDVTVIMKPAFPDTVLRQLMAEIGKASR